MGLTGSEGDHIEADTIYRQCEEFAILAEVKPSAPSLLGWDSNGNRFDFSGYQVEQHGQAVARAEQTPILDEMMRHKSGVAGDDLQHIGIDHIQTVPALRQDPGAIRCPEQALHLPARLQGVFVSDHEIQDLVEFWRAQVGASPYTMPGGAVDAPSISGVPLKQVPMFDEMAPASDEDPLLKDSINIIRKEGKASVSMLQRKFRIGYTRAARLVDAMQDKGIVGPPEGGTGVRQVLDYGPAAPPKEE